IQAIHKGCIDEPRARRVTKIGGCLVGADVAPTLRVEAVERGPGVSDTDTGGGRLTERNIETEHRAISIVGISLVSVVVVLRAGKAERGSPQLRIPLVGLACCSIVLALLVSVIGLIILLTWQLDAFHVRGPQPLKLLGGAVTGLRRRETGRTGLELRQCTGDGGGVRQ